VTTAGARTLGARETGASGGLRLLVVHAWVSGNVGDVLQTSVLLEHLRRLRPRRLDMAGCPGPVCGSARDMVALVDTLFPENIRAPFPKYLPDRIYRALWRADYSLQRAPLFSRYDAIVSAPGAFLASYDLRSVAALLDVAVARRLRIPFVFASHSIGPLDPAELSALARASCIVAREPETGDYLRRQGIASTPGADYAFLYRFDAAAAQAAGRRRIGGDYVVAFLRSDNLDFAALRMSDGCLMYGEERLMDCRGNRLVLATSDEACDADVLRMLAARLGAEVVVCAGPHELYALVAASAGTISDRYHPAICAARAGTLVRIVSNREPHKMDGLRQLVETRSPAEIEALSRGGLEAVSRALGR
jgi:polysaccharide pyruvyl transferase WcaK-like protein